MKSEVHVAHILVSCSATAAPADTLVAYRKIDSIYNAIISGKEDFAKLASENSDDRATRENGGDIGFMTAFQTLYPFENAAYNTPVGKISKPFRTPFGYHIVKIIEKRPARGEVQVAHILIATPKSKGEQFDATAKNRADSLYRLLRQGVSFDTLVAHFSDDKLTVAEHGVIPPFGAGRMVPSFENAAFALKNPGDFSEPVKTDFGYHIIKLVRHLPLRPYDSMQAELKRRVDNDPRSQIAHEQFMDKIKKAHGFKEFPDAYNAVAAAIKAIPDTGDKASVLRTSDFKTMNEPLFELGGHPYLQSDFIALAETMTHGRLNGPREAVTRDLYKYYVDKTGKRL